MKILDWISVVNGYCLAFSASYLVLRFTIGLLPVWDKYKLNKEIIFLASALLFVSCCIRCFPPK